MSDIPDDIMKAALGLRVLIGQKKHDRDLTETIARAILAERGRCAKVAESFKQIAGFRDDDCEAIAAAMLGGSHERW